MLIQQVHAEAAESLKKVSKKHKWTVGKWYVPSLFSHPISQERRNA